mgnify:CR=1 FL=1
MHSHWRLLAHNAFEHEVNPNRRAHGQAEQRNCRVDRPKKIVSRCWWTSFGIFDLHIAITSKMDFLTRFLKYEIIFAKKTIYFQNK